MSTVSYPSPVDKLLTYGDAWEVRVSPKDWSQYLELGIGPEHIPDLIRVATDGELRWAEEDSDKVWAPIHAWRTLGALHAEAAIEPLLSLLENIEEYDDDWALEELPEVYGMIGPAAIPALARYLADEAYPSIARGTVGTCLEKIAERYPESREECVAILMRQLEHLAENDEDLNASLILSLVNLKALEAVPLIERAFAADRVDTMLMGDWDDVQVELGMKTEEEVHEERRSRVVAERVMANINAGVSTSTPANPYIRQSSQKSSAGRKKARDKMAKQSRKKNKKRK